MTNLLTLKAKLIIGAVVIALLTTGAAIAVRRIKADAYKAGQTSERQLHANALRKAQQANDAATTALRSDLTLYAAQIDALSRQRRDREQVIVTRIEERIVNQPNCEIDPAIIEMRNQVRAEA